MIRRVHIQGFKTAIDVTLELGQLNVFVGPNGSGKTNVLEAIGLLGCAASGRVDYDAFRVRGVRQGTPVLYKSALRAGKRLLRGITLEATSDRARYRVSLGNPVESRAVSWRYASEELVEDGQELGARSPRKGSITLDGQGNKKQFKQEEDVGLGPAMHPYGEGALNELLRTLERYTLYTPFTQVLAGALQELAPRTPLGPLGGSLAQCAYSLRSHPDVWKRVLEETFAVVDWADNARVEATTGWPARGASASGQKILRLRDRFMKPDVPWLSTREVNEGMLYVLFLFMLLLHPHTPPMVAIDNVEHTLNPRLVRRLLTRVQQILREEPRRPQLLLTTQHPSVLDALDIRGDAVRLFTVTRGQGGATAVERFPYTDALAELGEDGMTLSELWTSGALGGMPVL
ncbi:MAG TPA: AAA family ATPase [Candidatus Nanopelagicales bacterium]|nr:AAA family ATPase [Candidatus Nanopelagicales bacterium]